MLFHKKYPFCHFKAQKQRIILLKLGLIKIIRCFAVNVKSNTPQQATWRNYSAFGRRMHIFYIILKLRLPEGCMASDFLEKAVTVADFTKHFSAFVKNRQQFRQV